MTAQQIAWNGRTFETARARILKNSGKMVVWKLKNPALRKRRTREHIIADLGVNFVEKQALLAGYTAERVMYDYGYDLFLTTFDAVGEIEPGEIRVQIKASDAPRVLKRGDTINVTISRSDITLWIDERMPVILIIYDAGSDRAYWLYMQRYLDNLPDLNIFKARKTMAVHIPTANILDQAVMKQFAMFRNSRRRQMNGRMDYDA